MHANAQARRGIGRCLALVIFGLFAVQSRAVLADPNLLSGLSGSSESAAVDATAPSEINSRLEVVASERGKIDQEIASSGAARRAHLEGLRDGLAELQILLEREAEIAGAAGKPIAGAAAVVGDGREHDKAEITDDLSTSPFSLFALYERQAAREGIPDRLAETRRLLAAAKEAFHAAEVKRRRARTKWELAEGNAKLAAEQNLSLRRLESRIAQERLNIRSLEVNQAERLQEERLQGAEADSSGLAERIQEMRKRLAGGEGQSEDGFYELIEREGEYRRLREKLDRRLATADLRLSAAKNRFSAEREAPNSLLQEVEALSGARDAVKQEIALVDDRIERLVRQRDTWRKWEQILRGAESREEIEAWEVAIEERVAMLTESRVELQGRVADLRQRIDTLDARIEKLSGDSRLRTALVEERSALRRLDQAQGGAVQSIVSDLRFAKRVLEDVYDRTGHIDPFEYAARTARVAREVWNYEITVVDDAPITFGSLVLALFLFSIGLWVSRRGSAAVGRIVRKRFMLDAGAGYALETMAFYGLLVGFSLLSLRAVHFPLTAFTVLGGALAIGIGFGSQNVMNNFISGLILMLERPVRVRDVVEVDGNHGTIEHIGARSTQIRSTDGRHIVVPNSFFLESNVVNWTLSDDLARAKVTVGVIYGSPTRLVEELIHRVVNEEAAVLKVPAPILIFQEFGDNSLNFDIFFWVKARSPMEMRKVESLIRFRIDDLFREHGLVIAFPQRDVHLDSVSPIEVRMVNDPSETGSEDDRL